MFTLHSNNPSLIRWQTRLARVPRWAWIAFFVGAVIPAVALMIFLLITFFAAGLIVMGAALLVGAVIGGIRRLIRPTRRLPSNQIVIRSVRVIDP